MGKIESGVDLGSDSPFFHSPQCRLGFEVNVYVGWGVLRKYLYGDAQSRLQNVDHLYTCVLQKKKKKKKTPDHYTSRL